MSLGWFLGIALVIQCTGSHGQILGHAAERYGDNVPAEVTGQEVALNPTSVYFLKQNQFYLSHSSWFLNLALNFSNYKAMIDNADRITSHFRDTIEHLFSDVGAAQQPVENGSLSYVTLQGLYEYRALKVYAQ